MVGSGPIKCHGYGKRMQTSFCFFVHTSIFLTLTISLGRNIPKSWMKLGFEKWYLHVHVAIFYAYWKEQNLRFFPYGNSKFTPSKSKLRFPLLYRVYGIYSPKNFLINSFRKMCKKSQINRSSPGDQYYQRPILQSSIFNFYFQVQFYQIPEVLRKSVQSIVPIPDSVIPEFSQADSGLSPWN